MKQSSRIIMVFGGLFGFFAVAFGAFGAHALRGTLPPGLYQAFQTGVQYQGLHGVALLVVGLLCQSFDDPWIRRSGWIMGLGVLLFSGSLYLMALTGLRPLGMITPLGGITLLLGWLLLLIGIVRLPAGPTP